MIGQLFRIVWNRKRSNILIILEICITYLVLFGLVTTALYFLYNYRHPLGYSWVDVWDVSAQIGDLYETRYPDNANEFMDRMIRAVEAFDEVEAAGAASYIPYSNMMAGDEFTYRNREIESWISYATDGFKDVVGIEISSGRWFDRTDDVMDKVPLVVNRRFCRELFGEFPVEDPVGTVITSGSGEHTEEFVIVGITPDFRKGGELSTPGNHVLCRTSLAKPDDHTPINIVFKVRRGTTADLEEKIVKKLHAMAPDWSFEVKTWEERRTSSIKVRMIPFLIFAMVAFFMLIMVVLGLFGVLWLNVTRRTREFGVRRAKGATITDIHYQILGELGVVCLAGIALGVIVAVQFPLLQLIPFFNPMVCVAGMIISSFLIFGITILCGLYPSHMATRIRPAEALHYE
jgi:putative ABC transport system permease protein